MTSPSTKYWWQVRADDGNDTSIKTYSFTTGVAPSIIVETNDAFNIEENYGWLSGEITYNVLGIDCNVKFQYWEHESSTVYETVNQSGYNVGETFTDNISLPTAGTLYVYRAVADNGFGALYGENITFISKPNEHASMTLTNTTTGFNLSWTDPTLGNINNSVLVYNNDHIPTSRTDGTVLYNGTANFYNHSNLTTGGTYYYSLWAMSTYYPTYRYSDVYLSDSGYFVGYPNVTTDGADTSDTAQDPAAEVHLHGTLLDDGEETCYVGFEYGTTDAFGTTTKWYGSEGAFYKILTTLTRGKKNHKL